MQRIGKVRITKAKYHTIKKNELRNEMFDVLPTIPIHQYKCGIQKVVCKLTSVEF